MAEGENWAGPRPLRITTVLSFILAFPLCLAHGVISRQAVPAVGLVPQIFSAGLGIFLLRHADRGDNGHPHPHPAIIFAADAVLAAALMVVLVFTWIDGPRSGNAGLSMLASYATIPLLTNFLIHLFLSLRAVYVGLALDSLAQWLAWQAVPPDCPNCQHRLRPDLPTFPWLRRANEQYARLFVATDEESRYRDEDEGGASRVERPEAVDVVKKNGKGKGATAVTEGSTPWGT